MLGNKYKKSNKTKPEIAKRHHNHLMSPVLRLSNLGDGIFSITMTILVFDLKFNHTFTTEAAFQHMLLSNWPLFLSFTISFIILAQLWMANVTILKYLRRADHEVIWLNVIFLLFVCLIPFSASSLGKYPTSLTVNVVYGLNMLMAMLSNFWIWKHILARTDILTHNSITVTSRHFGHKVSYFAITGYTLGITCSFIHPMLALFIYTFIPFPFVVGWIYKLRKLEEE